MRIALAAVVALGLVGIGAGCGKEADLSDIDEGETFEIHDIRFNVLYDRTLNASQVEDAEYLVGQPIAPTGHDYFGVFVLLKNLGDGAVPAPGLSDFQITDTTEVVYRPIESESSFSFPFGVPIDGDSEIPDPDSVAAAGPTQGSVLLFLLDQNVSENRPLTMRIRYLGEEAEVKLDL